MVTGQLYRNYFVSIVTQTTVDRLHKVSMMAEKWKAPMSVSVFIKKPSKDIPELKKKLQNYPSLVYYADLHLLFANNTRYPVNNLRNLAIENSRTDFVFIMDADFLPPLGLHDYIQNQKHFFKINQSNQINFKNNLLNGISNQQTQVKENSNIEQKDSSANKIIHTQSFRKNNLNKIDSSGQIDSSFNMDSYHGSASINSLTEDNSNDIPNLKIAFVIPSFSSSELPEFLPDDKEEMIEMVKSNKVTPSNINVCKKCHSPTNFPKWIEAKEPYEIEYKWIFEPYLVFNRSESLPFDERLKGYGFDKNSHAFSMAVEGFRFVVLPESFIIHVNHKSSSWEGPSLDEQQWDALRIVCDIIPSIKTKNNYNISEKLFDEPLEDECYSDNHW
ncbi:hypothetical protein DICPUDRAFT_51901 [Dictyostelium purpureum]|uniref:Uncharacterized protein n=1 Tax=Dictyostelium purpureum TaxID=5786 RepID=F1A626_DICPU|nr:uncharacterized protein DICPUDRAFT_51901 [Dictyostelium purpureum]EGC28356.1 hypothetical protein DICPUDRAFT_51901 [Dictyostelium purpureum]|eukprot:XP_003295120.1 hypothetical protein DICPUDRAFT_51901 [Dictyostelium purpureum]